MAAKKGQVHNPRGRPKGAINNVSKEVKEIMADILKKRLKNIHERLDSCEPKDELQFLAKISEFVVSKPAAEQPGADVPVVSTLEAVENKLMSIKKTGS